MTAMPTRIETDLYDAAKAVGVVMSRSAAQQINHWARIGRELEAAQGVRHRDVVAVLAGNSSYDALNVREQVLVRAEWDERIAETRGDLDFELEFTAAGESWVEADADGQTVLRDPARKRRPTRRTRAR